MKLKYWQYFGQFYEHEGKIGWMPWYKAIIAKMIAPDSCTWLKYSDIKFI